MDFYKYKCPVCDKKFMPGDDIVVCPECGAPHHRECFEQNGNCFYQDKHSEGFSFENGSTQSKAEDTADNDEAEGSEVICPMCKTANSRETFYCSNCGYPLNEEDRQQSAGYQNGSFQGNNNPQPGAGQPFGGTGFGFGAASFDPMAGLNPEQEIGNNVTAGEVSKFVGKTTPYYLLIFNRIFKKQGSRFNFSAFLFSGAYFIYRKMLALGLVISFVIIGLSVVENFIRFMPEYQSLLSSLNEISRNSQGLYVSYTDYFSSGEIFFLLSPYIFSLLKGVVMVICGIAANKCYYNHCIKKINGIKRLEGVNVSEELEKSGGVNLPVAAGFAITIFSLYYLPYIISIFRF